MRNGRRNKTDKKWQSIRQIKRKNVCKSYEVYQKAKRATAAVVVAVVVVCWWRRLPFVIVLIMAKTESKTSRRFLAHDVYAAFAGWVSKCSLLVAVISNKMQPENGCSWMAFSDQLINSQPALADPKPEPAELLINIARNSRQASLELAIHIREV